MSNKEYMKVHFDWYTSVVIEPIINTIKKELFKNIKDPTIEKNTFKHGVYDHNRSSEHILIQSLIDTRMRHVECVTFSVNILTKTTLAIPKEILRNGEFDITKTKDVYVSYGNDIDTHRPFYKLGYSDDTFAYSFEQYIKLFATYQTNELGRYKRRYPIKHYKTLNSVLMDSLNKGDIISDIKDPLHNLMKEIELKPSTGVMTIREKDNKPLGISAIINGNTVGFEINPTTRKIVINKSM